MFTIFGSRINNFTSDASEQSFHHPKTFTFLIVRKYKNDEAVNHKNDLTGRIPEAGI